MSTSDYAATAYRAAEAFRQSKGPVADAVVQQLIDLPKAKAILVTSYMTQYLADERDPSHVARFGRTLQKLLVK